MRHSAAQRAMSQARTTCCGCSDPPQIGCVSRAGCTRPALPLPRFAVRSAVSCRRHASSDNGTSPSRPGRPLGRWELRAARCQRAHPRPPARLAPARRCARRERVSAPHCSETAAARRSPAHRKPSDSQLHTATRPESKALDGEGGTVIVCHCQVVNAGRAGRRVKQHVRQQQQQGQSDAWAHADRGRNPRRIDLQNDNRSSPWGRGTSLQTVFARTRLDPPRPTHCRSCVCGDAG